MPPGRYYSDDAIPYSVRSSAASSPVAERNSNNAALQVMSATFYDDQPFNKGAGAGAGFVARIGRARFLVIMMMVLPMSLGAWVICNSRLYDVSFVFAQDGRMKIRRKALLRPEPIIQQLLIPTPAQIQRVASPVVPRIKTVQGKRGMTVRAESKSKKQLPRKEPPVQTPTAMQMTPLEKKDPLQHGGIFGLFSGIRVKRSHFQMTRQPEPEIPVMEIRLRTRLRKKYKSPRGVTVRQPALTMQRQEEARLQMRKQEDKVRKALKLQQMAAAKLDAERLLEAKLKAEHKKDSFREMVKQEVARRMEARMDTAHIRADMAMTAKLEAAQAKLDARLEAAMVKEAKLEAVAQAKLEAAMAKKATWEVAAQAKLEAATVKEATRVAAARAKLEAAAQAKLEAATIKEAKLEAAAQAKLEAATIKEAKLEAVAQAELEAATIKEAKLEAAAQAKLEVEMAKETKREAAAQAKLEAAMTKEAKREAAAQAKLEVEMAKEAKREAAAAQAKAVESKITAKKQEKSVMKKGVNKKEIQEAGAAGFWRRIRLRQRSATETASAEKKDIKKPEEDSQKKGWSSAIRLRRRPKKKTVEKTPSAKVANAKAPKKERIKKELQGASAKSGGVVVKRRTSKTPPAPRRSVFSYAMGIFSGTSETAEIAQPLVEKNAPESVLPELLKHFASRPEDHGRTRATSIREMIQTNKVETARHHPVQAAQPKYATIRVGKKPPQPKRPPAIRIRRVKSKRTT